MPPRAMVPSPAGGGRRTKRSTYRIVTAVADALRVEYKAIGDAGFTLQIDDPRLSSHYISNPNLTAAELRK